MQDPAWKVSAFHLIISYLLGRCRRTTYRCPDAWSFFHVAS